MRSIPLLLCSLWLAGCSLWMGAFHWSAEDETAAEAKDEGEQALRLVKMLSWAEPAPEGCDTDLEGSAPPARFDLRYTTGGEAVTIESDVDQLFARGWSIVNRSERGYGFEKVGSFEKVDFDIVEELRCKCGELDDTQEGKHIVRIDIDWQEGDERPDVRGQVGEGKNETKVEPVTINGRLAMYQFRFTRPLPGDREGVCSSRFLAALEFAKPLE